MESLIKELNKKYPYEGYQINRYLSLANKIRQIQRKLFALVRQTS